MAPSPLLLALSALAAAGVREQPAQELLAEEAAAARDEPQCAALQANPSFPKWCGQHALVPDGSNRLVSKVCPAACASALGRGSVRPPQAAVPAGDNPLCGQLYDTEHKALYCSGDMYFNNDKNAGLIRDVCKNMCNSAPAGGDPVCKFYADQPEPTRRIYCTTDFKAGDGRLVREVCKQLCASYAAGAGQPGAGPAAPVGGAGNAGAYAELLGWKPKPSSCPAPDNCIRGGYGGAQQPQFSWDICSGCWRESCVRDLNFEAEARMFRPNDKAADWDASIMLLSKAYPLGASMWDFQRQKALAEAKRNGGSPWDSIQLQGVINWQDLKDLENWANTVNGPTHENVHVHHSSTGIFRPSNDFNYAIQSPWQKRCLGGPQSCVYDMEEEFSVTDQFPRRGEINGLFDKDIQDALGGPRYFSGDLSKCSDLNQEKGCQRLHGLMTETEAYMHGQVASSVFSTGVGTGNTWTPKIMPYQNAGNNGATFPVAFWSLANVYYLQLTKKKHPETWQNLLGRGPKDWRKISELFLAYVDRATWFLRLSLEANDMTDDWHQRGIPPAIPPYKALTNKCRRLQQKALEDDDVLTPLRKALEPSGCKRGGR